MTYVSISSCVGEGKRILEGDTGDVVEMRDKGKFGGQDFS